MRRAPASAAALDTMASRSATDPILRAERWGIGSRWSARTSAAAAMRWSTDSVPRNVTDTSVSAAMPGAA